MYTCLPASIVFKFYRRLFEENIFSVRILENYRNLPRAKKFSGQKRIPRLTYTWPLLTEAFILLISLEACANAYDLKK